MMTAWFAYAAKRHSKEINDAVNHVHKADEGGGLRIYDLVLRNDSRIGAIESMVHDVKSDVKDLKTKCDQKHQCGYKEHNNAK